MSSSPRVHRLRQLVGSFRGGGNPVAADLAQELRAIGTGMGQADGALQQVCVEAARTVQQAIGDELLDAHADELLDYLSGVANFIEAWSADDGTGEPGTDAAMPRPPELPQADAEQQLSESIGMFVGSALCAIGDLEEELLAIESAGACPTDSVSSIRRTVHTLKAEFGVLNLAAPQLLCHQAESCIDACTENGAPFPVDAMLAVCDLVKQFVERLADDVHADFGDAEPLLGRLRHISARANDAAIAASGGPSPSDGAAGGATPAARAGSAKAPRVERTIRVSTTRLDMLVDLVGELVIAQSMVLQDPSVQQLTDPTLVRNIGQVGKLTRDLQEAAMSLRMVTVRSTFRKMARLVRDAATRCGKRVSLSVTGEDTELDRNVVELISDPLVHLIRNAIDHGVEAPDERVAAGKAAAARLELAAYHEGGAIVVEVSDDGRGIDRDRVFEKAVAAGVIPADTSPQSMSDAEVHELIFLPGFSTADRITDLSGRGVGMDVVKRSIDALRGKIEIDSRLGAGTTFRLRLPLTLAIIDGMIVRIGDSRYVVPTLSIEQSFRPCPGDVHLVVDRGECIHVRGAVLPIYRLKEIFGQRDGVDDLAEGILIVVESDGRRSCLFVDEIVGQHQVVIKSLGMPRDRTEGLAGGAIMTDGRVALILDIGTLVNSIVTAASSQRAEP